MNTIQITCDCKVCNGESANLDANRAKGLTPTMTHNYVQAANHMHPVLAARMGVTKVA